MNGCVKILLFIVIRNGAFLHVGSDQRQGSVLFIYSMEKMNGA
jgi:hypothetical protein